MAKNTLTNAQALTAATELATNAGMDELAAKLAHMAEMAAKPRKSKGEKTPTKAQLANFAMAKEAVAKMREHGEPVSSKWIMENVRYVTSTQKVTAIMRIALDNGWVVKGEPVKGAARYEVAPEA